MEKNQWDTDTRMGTTVEAETGAMVIVMEAAEEAQVMAIAMERERLATTTTGLLAVETG